MLSIMPYSTRLHSATGLATVDYNCRPNILMPGVMETMVRIGTMAVYSFWLE